VRQPNGDQLNLDSHPKRAVPLINGESREPISDNWFEGSNYADRDSRIRYANCGPEDVNEAVRNADQAFSDGRWANQSPLMRKSILLEFADQVEAAAEILGTLDSIEMGRPITQAINDARFLTAGILRYHAEAIDKVYGTVAPSCSDSHVLQTWSPCGVVAAITPWNFPSVNAMCKIAPALAAGNSCVLKPSETASLSALKLAEIGLQAGLPAGILNVVTGNGDVGRLLAEHPDVAMIAFTGSTATGRSIMASASTSGIKRLLLECGGKSPQIVFEDVQNFDLEQLAAALVAEVMWNAGQVCVAKSRLLVQKKLLDSLKPHLVTAISAYRPEDPLLPDTMFGPLGSAAQFDRVNALVADAVSNGAESVTAADVSVPKNGNFVLPTLLFDVTADTRAVREEIFGPVMTVQSFETVEEAIAMSNDTDTGLAATVWTTDLRIAHQMGRDIRAGDVSIRGSLAEVEGSGFAGIGEPMKASGFGVETGTAGLQSYAIRKSISFAFG
jgi:acyl-CoA reductase-like NAD-dependent aldehyde dehydrogenase